MVGFVAFATLILKADDGMTAVRTFWVLEAWETYAKLWISIGLDSIVLFVIAVRQSATKVVVAITALINLVSGMTVTKFGETL